MVQPLFRRLILPQTAAHHQDGSSPRQVNIGVPHEAHDFRVKQVHRLPRLAGCVLRGIRFVVGNPHPPGASPGCALRSQPGRTGHAQPAAHHQHVTAIALVGITRAGRQKRRGQGSRQQYARQVVREAVFIDRAGGIRIGVVHAGIVEIVAIIRIRFSFSLGFGRYIAPCTRIGRAVHRLQRAQLRFQRQVGQRCHPDTARMPQARPRVQPRLVGNHRHRLACLHDRSLSITHRCTTVCIQPAGHINGQHRHPSAVHPPDQSSHAPRQRTGQANAEEPVDDQGRLGRRHVAVIVVLIVVIRCVAVRPQPVGHLLEAVNDLAIGPPGFPGSARILGLRGRGVQPRHAGRPHGQPCTTQDASGHQRITTIVARTHQQDHRRVRRQVLPHGQRHPGHGRTGARHQLARFRLVQPAAFQAADGGQVQHPGGGLRKGRADRRSDRTGFHGSKALS